jgi:predicted transposase/invertase (TIGR01784 family)
MVQLKPNEIPFDPSDPNIVLSPLADPVLGAIFTSAEEAGLASESLISAVLKSEGEKMRGKITRVTPQPSHSSPKRRGCKVDIDTITDANEYFRYEVEIDADMHIMVRDLFSASHLITESSNKGDTSIQMAKNMPFIRYINILGYRLRKTNTEMVQPFKVMYTKPPYEVAIPNFSGFNIQLPCVLDCEPNFTDDLFCWCYILYTAHIKKMTLKEVLLMTPALQAFAENNKGFRQFNDRYEFVSETPEVRSEYVQWCLDSMREEGIRDAGIAEGIERGRQEAILDSARRMKSEGFPIDAIAKVFNLTTSEIETL